MHIYIYMICWIRWCKTEILTWHAPFPLQRLPRHCKRRPSFSKSWRTTMCPRFAMYDEVCKVKDVAYLRFLCPSHNTLVDFFPSFLSKNVQNKIQWKLNQYKKRLLLRCIQRCKMHKTFLYYLALMFCDIVGQRDPSLPGHLRVG